MSDTTRYDLNAKELDALMLFSGPLGNMAKAAIGFLTGFDVLVPVDESLLTREEAANDPEVRAMIDTDYWGEASGGGVTDDE